VKNHRSLRQSLLKWYDRHRRDLPWRTSTGSLPDAYLVLVSEFMLQQTQVATVIPYFNRFIKTFPTLKQLAAADEHEVLRLWQGLGYYSRARNLHAAARRIVSEHNSRVPSNAAQLLDLPGIGRYTAGAIASLAFDLREPILDGNVARVVCRVDGIRTDPRERTTLNLLWKRAGELVPPERAGDFNSALMELGATVCTPRQPDCEHCPLGNRCQARELNLQSEIPPPKKKKPTPLIKRWTFAIRRGNRYLIERRPARGRWAGLWQFPTIAATAAAPTETTASTALGMPVRRMIKLGQVKHSLTHRLYEFLAFSCAAANRVQSPGDARKWIQLSEVGQYAFSKPQQMIAAMLVGRPNQD